MEGPSIVIACEELAPFLKKPILRASGTIDLPFSALKRLDRVSSWGKHLLLEFPDLTLRVHFLMFGSYRIGRPRENRQPKLLLEYRPKNRNEHQTISVYFYSCSIKRLEAGWKKTYDWSADLMSKAWDRRQPLARMKEHPEEQVADLLMNQEVFSGLGNIMKNEILFNLRMHPETLAKALSPARRRALVKEAESYAWRFYEWKKKNVLKKNWQIMRKKKCPRCGGPVTKRETGRLRRISHYCKKCQGKA